MQVKESRFPPSPRAYFFPNLMYHRKALQHVLISDGEELDPNINISIQIAIAYSDY